MKLLLPNGLRSDGRICAEVVDGQQRICRLVFDHPLTGRLSREDRDFYRCLRGLRIELEKHGIQVLCNGARRDVVITGMASGMSHGMKVYRVSKHEPVGSLDTLVPLFGEADPALVATVAEQESCQADYWHSVGVETS